MLRTCLQANRMAQIAASAPLEWSHRGGLTYSRAIIQCADYVVLYRDHRSYRDGVQPALTSHRLALFLMKDVPMNSLRATSFPFASADLTKPWAGFKLPAFKLDTLLEAHRKNADALTNANHVVFDGLNRMAQCQGELFTTTVNDFSRVTRDVVAGASFGEKSTNQVDAVRHIYVSSVAGLRELSDIAVRTNVTAVDILNTRVSEAFDEFRALFAMPAAPAAISAPEVPAAISAPEVAAEPVTVVEEAPANVAASAKAKPAGSGDAKSAARKAAPAAKPTRRPTSRG